MLEINDMTITSHILSNIRKSWSIKARERYLTEKRNWNIGEFENIDGEIFQHVSESFSFLKNNFIFEWINKIILLNLQHYRYKMVEDPFCPSRCQCEENEKYFLRCPQVDRQKIYDTFLKWLPKIFNQYNIDLDIRLATKTLSDVKTPTTLENNKSATYLQILTQQQKLVIDLMYYGLLYNIWIIKQTEYLKIMNLPNNRQQAYQGIQQNHNRNIYVPTYSMAH